MTAREVEVLRLVAQGLTNEQVAEELVISPRTVNTHLTAIYGKIGVPSAAPRPAMPSNSTWSNNRLRNSTCQPEEGRRYNHAQIRKQTRASTDVLPLFASYTVSSGSR